MTERARPAFEVYSTGKEAVSVEILTVFFLRVSRVLAHAWLAQGGGRCGLGAAVGPDWVAYRNTALRSKAVHGLHAVNSRGAVC
jgi:hypothetical protein